MSLENVKKFYEKLINNESFQKKIQKIDSKICEENLKNDKKLNLNEILIKFLPKISEEIGDVTLKDFLEFEKELKKEYVDENKIYNINFGLLNICYKEGKVYDISKNKKFLKCQMLGIGFMKKGNSLNKCKSFGFM